MKRPIRIDEVYLVQGPDGAMHERTVIAVDRASGTVLGRGPNDRVYVISLRRMQHRRGVRLVRGADGRIVSQHRTALSTVLATTAEERRTASDLRKVTPPRGMDEDERERWRRRGSVG